MLDFALHILTSKLHELKIEKRMWINQQKNQYIDSGIFERIDYEIASLKEAIIILKACTKASNIIIESKINYDGTL
jgi:hypothetical protein